MNQEDYAELVRRRPDLAHHFRLVRAGGHIKRGYWRRKARDENNMGAREPSKLKSQLAFTKAAYNVYGERGLREGIPVAASAVQKSMKGKRYRESNVAKVIRVLAEAMKEAVKAVEAIEAVVAEEKRKKRKK